MNDAVGVDVKGNLNLRHSARCRRDSHQIKPSQSTVVDGHVSLTLEHVDADRGLIVRRCGEYLAFLGRYGGISLNKPGHHGTQSLYAQRQRGHVQKKHVLHLSGKHTGLYGSADCDHLIRIDSFMRFLAEKALDYFLHFGHARLSAYQDYLVDI